MAARGSAPRSCASCWLGNRLLAHAPAGEMTTNGLQALLVMLGAFRDARLITIGGGASEIMKEIIAKLVPGF